MNIQQSTLDIHSEITQAAELTPPKLAQSSLEALKKRHWSTIEDRARFRIEANLGHSKAKQEKFSEAAHHYLEAKRFQPEDLDARELEAVAYLYLGEMEKVHELSSSICLEAPHRARSQQLRIRTAPEAKSYKELRKELPAAVLGDPEVQISLLSRAEREELWGEVESCAREAVRLCPDWIEAKFFLASAIVKQVMARVGVLLTPGIANDNSSTSRIDEARALLTKVQQDLADDGRVSLRANVAFKFAIVHWLLGDRNAHDEALKESLGLHHADNVLIRLVYSLSDSGREDEAIQILRSTISKTPTAASVSVLADFLIQRNKSDDLAAALNLLEANSALLNTSSQEDRDAYIDIYVVEIAKTGEVEQARKILEQFGSFASVNVREILKVRLCLFNEASGEAEKIALALYESNRNRDLSFEETARIAGVLEQTRHFDAAFAMWKKVVPTNRVNPGTLRMISVGRQARREADLLDFLRNLRAQDIWDRSTVGVEVDLLVSLGEYTQAFSLLNATVERFPNDLVVRVRRASLAIELNQKDGIDDDVSCLLSAENVSAELGHAIVIILLHSSNPIAALPYAYKLVRRFPDAPGVNAAMAVTRFPLLGETPNLPKPECVELGSAVRYRVKGEDPRWVIIEEEENPPPSSVRNEISPDSTIAKALIGRRVNDKTILQLGFGAREAVIELIVSKFDYRAQEIANSWEHRFPDHPFVAARKMPKNIPEAPKNIEDVLGEEFVKLIRQQEHAAENTKRVYADYQIPIGGLSAMCHRTVSETLSILIQDGDVKIRCCEGSRDEQLAAALPFKKGTRLVLEATAWSTLLNLRCPIFKDPNLQLVVPEAILESARFRKMLLARGSNAGEELEYIQAFLDFVAEHCEVAGGAEIARMDAESRRLLEELSGGTTQALCIATARRLPIWTDDFAVSALAQHKFAIPGRVWTQITLSEIAKRGVLSQIEYDEASIKLHGWGYIFTSISPTAMLLAFQRSGWDSNSTIARSVAKTFQDDLTLESILSLFANTLVLVWRQAPSVSSSQEFTDLMIHSLPKVCRGTVLIGTLRNIGPFFGVDVVNADRAVEYLRSYIAHGQQSESGLYLPGWVITNQPEFLPRRNDWG